MENLLTCGRKAVRRPGLAAVGVQGLAQTDAVSGTGIRIQVMDKSVYWGDWRNTGHSHRIGFRRGRG